MDRRETLKALFSAGLAAIAPDDALLRHLRLDGDTLRAGDRCWELAGRRIVALGAGKGAAPMARALEKLLGPRLSEGLVVVKHGHTLPLERIRLLEAAHPVPDAAGVSAARAMLDMAARAGDTDLVITLFTGGASALTPLPAPGLTLDDIQRTTSLLLHCGATINQLNAVRKHLSLFSGGQLARAAQPAPVLSVIVSDVVGDPLDVIASGPTAPDPSTFAEASDIVTSFELADKLPPAVWERLLHGAAGLLEDTPKADHPLFANVCNVLAATNRQALEAAAAQARALGWDVEILTDSLTGEARERARELVQTAKQRLAARGAGSRPLCLLAGGETTVTIRGAGKGGRNQEMALAASFALADEPRVAALFAGTDGTDGPTDAAGGFADSGALQRITRAAGQSPAVFLDDNNSYPALQAAGDLYITGPTLTNVMDMAILLVTP